MSRFVNPLRLASGAVQVLETQLGKFTRTALVVAGFAAASLYAVPADAMKIEPVTSPGGIKAWLVQNDSVPLVTMNFAFRGAGSAQDPAGKEGLANLMSTMLDEGAGPLDSTLYQNELTTLGVRLGFSATRDNFVGRLTTLASERDQAFDLLRLALTEPRFDQEPIERMRAQIVAGIRASDEDPNEVAGRLWSAAAFPDHPYGRPADGTVETVSRLTAADLKAFRGRTFARDNLVVAVVGAIDAETLGKLLDKTFGALPEKADLTPVPNVVPKTDLERERAMPAAQTIIQFGGPGVLRNDPDFIPAYVMNHILGGGTFTSWLFEEVREKRGLTYGIETYLAAYDHAGMFLGGTATKPENAAEALKLIREQIRRMAETGPTEKELADAKRFITGSYPLRFDTSGGIAGQLLGIQLDNLGIDYIDKRNSLVEAVTLEDVRRAAKRILDAGAPTVVLTGDVRKPT